MRKEDYEEIQRLCNHVHILTTRIDELEAAAQWPMPEKGSES